MKQHYTFPTGEGRTRSMRLPGGTLVRSVDRSTYKNALKAAGKVLETRDSQRPDLDFQKRKLEIEIR